MIDASFVKNLKNFTLKNNVILQNSLKILGWNNYIFLQFFFRLFAKLPRPGDSERTFSVFESSCHLLLSVEPSTIEAIPFSALPKDTTSELSSH